MACQFTSEVGQQLDGNDGIVPGQLVEATAVEHVADEFFIGCDGRRARFLVEQGEFAEHRAG